jgi:hypothetical protein
MGEPNKQNHRLFYVIQDDDLTEDEILEEVKKAHRKGADINPIDKNTELTILQTAKNQNFQTVVKYLEDKISESEALNNNKLNVGQTSNSQKTLNDNKIVGSSSNNNDNENKASNQNKDTTNVASSNAKTNPIRKSVNVPGDGSCLFWAVTLAFLFPVRHDSAEFERRFQKLFDAKCPSKISIYNYFYKLQDFYSLCYLYLERERERERERDGGGKERER